MLQSEKLESLSSIAETATGLTSISRRDLMRGFAATAMAGGLGATALAQNSADRAASGYPKLAPAAGDTLKAGDSSPAVETEYGRIRGYIRNGIYTFKNVPYGADTSGANRFMPPQKPTPWAGVRVCLHHGFVSPQARRTAWDNPEEGWLFDWDDGIQSEDCLNLNVW